jgi:hypothetical protein
MPQFTELMKYMVTLLHTKIYLQVDGSATPEKTALALNPRNLYKVCVLWISLDLNAVHLNKKYKSVYNDTPYIIILHTANDYVNFTFDDNRYDTAWHRSKRPKPARIHHYHMGMMQQRYLTKLESTYFRLKLRFKCTTAIGMFTIFLQRSS